MKQTPAYQNPPVTPPYRMGIPLMIFFFLLRPGCSLVTENEDTNAPTGNKLVRV
jgi:hypothetical protein